MTKQIEVSDEVFEKIKDIVNADEVLDVTSLDDFVGKKLFIRTVTYHLIGEVKARVGQFFHLKNASWVADSGRFMDALKTGKLSEVEPVGEAFVNVNSITDMFVWKHVLTQRQI